MKHTPQSIQNKEENGKTRIFVKEGGKDPMALSAKIYADS